MKKRLALFLLLPLSLLGCAKSGTPDYALPLNGDLYGVSELSEYNTACPYLAASRLIEKMEAGESVAFLLTSTTCSHCATWKTTFLSFLKDCPYLIYLFEAGDLSLTTYWQAVESFQNYFGNIDKITDATPQLYIGKKGAFQRIGDAGLSYQDLKNSFTAYSASNSLRFFTDISAYKNYLSANPSALTYFADLTSGGPGQSFYDTALYPLAKTSNKPLALLDYEAMDEANRSAVLSALSLESYAPILRQDGTAYDVSKESEAASATSLIFSYFA